MKTPFTEKEIDELCDMYYNTGEMYGLSSALRILEEELKLSKVHSSVVAIRKYLYKKNNENYNKLKERYPNSTLSNKLSTRLDEEEIDKT